MYGVGRPDSGHNRRRSLESQKTQKYDVHWSCDGRDIITIALKLNVSFRKEKRLNIK